LGKAAGRWNLELSQANIGGKSSTSTACRLPGQRIHKHVLDCACHQEYGCREKPGIKGVVVVRDGGVMVEAERIL
jgi:hypothetical protein